jgi:hypothetical protein
MKILVRKVIIYKFQLNLLDITDSTVVLSSYYSNMKMVTETVYEISFYVVMNSKEVNLK